MNAKRHPELSDLTVVWYRASATGVGWWPVVVTDPGQVEATREQLRRRFHGKGGVETMVKEYVEMETRK